MNQYHGTEDGILHFGGGRSQSGNRNGAGHRRRIFAVSVLLLLGLPGIARANPWYGYYGGYPVQTGGFGCSRNNSAEPENKQDTWEAPGYCTYGSAPGWTSGWMQGETDRNDADEKVNEQRNSRDSGQGFGTEAEYEHKTGPGSGDEVSGDRTATQDRGTQWNQTGTVWYGDWWRQAADMGSRSGKTTGTISEAKDQQEQQETAAKTEKAPTAETKAAAEKAPAAETKVSTKTDAEKIAAAEVKTKEEKGGKDQVKHAAGAAEAARTDNIQKKDAADDADVTPKKADQPPELNWIGIRDGTVCNGNIRGQVTASSSEPMLWLELRDASGHMLTLKTQSAEAGAGGTSLSVPLPDISEDGYYRMTAMAVDAAGQKTEETLELVMNRSGSCYQVSGPEGNILTAGADSLKVCEMNLSRLAEIRLTLYRDMIPILLEEGRDYQVRTEKLDQGYRYTYVLSDTLLPEDGCCSLQIHSVDEAGNVSENTMPHKSADIDLIVDRTAPLIRVLSIETGAAEGLEYRSTVSRIVFRAEDDDRLTQIRILDGDRVIAVFDPSQTAAAESDGRYSEDCGSLTAVTYSEEAGLYCVTMQGKAEMVRILAEDAAGHMTCREVQVREDPEYHAGSLWTAAPLILLAVLAGRKRNHAADTSLLDGILV